MANTSISADWGTSRIARALWILQYLQKYGTITYPIAQEAFGVSVRSYRRYLRLLVESGAILKGNYGPGGGGTTFLGFDPRLAPIRRNTAA